MSVAMKKFRDWFIKEYPNFHFTVEQWEHKSLTENTYMKIWAHIDILPRGKKDRPSNYRPEKVTNIFVFENIELLELSFDLLKLIAKSIIRNITKTIDKGWRCLKSNLDGECLKKRYFTKYKFKDGVKHEIV